MKYFLISENLPAEMRRALSAYGEPIPLPAWRALPFPICAHPDMLAAKIGRCLLIHEEYREGRAILERLEIPYLLSLASVGRDYPRDIRLNCLATEKFFLSNEKYISREALALADEQGLRRIHVKQGDVMSRCIYISLMENGVKWSLDRSTQAVIRTISMQD